eukprot:CAMPEP_0119265410 /NCGR_PEP_ID=MMETSP1329-20130426/4231_1 /TAXON_ID=114041 /ORGANISM="Genus nov. species nov., Strain RCC1024" /LENGTH=383 /DNA_ID=CAMNT_0007265235 /DNA_START=127 /DNA_END=1275 /DNA_ORIENTATION=-
MRPTKALLLLALLRPATPLSAASWAQLGLRAPVAAAVTTEDWPAPTAVQAAAVPRILESGDCVVHARTGSGKTLAYLLPLLDGVDAERGVTQAVVVVPTRELGLQVAKVARRLCAALPGDIQCMSALDGSKLRRQRAWAWAEPPQVIIGNAGPLLDLAEKGALKCASVKLRVVDEVDAFFCDDESRRALHRLLAEDELLGSDASCRTVFATATVQEPRKLAQRLRQLNWSRGPPELVAVDAAPPPRTRHWAARCPEPRKRLAVAQRVVASFLKRAEGGGAMVFCRDSREGALPDLAAAFGSASVLRSRDDLGARQAALEAYSSGEVDVLVCTDLAARGLDAPRTALVVNLDVPAEATAYLHRAGRTGRLERAGTVVTVVEDAE